MSNMVDLNDFANGALAARFNEELKKVLENIQDPNTKAKSARKITLTLSLQPDEDRELAIVDIQAKSTLVHRAGVSTKLLIDRDNDGKVVGKELKSGVKGQTYMEEDGLYQDTGEKIVDFKQNQRKAGGGK